METITTSVCPPGICYGFSKNLLLSSVGRMYLNIDKYCLKMLKKYPKSSRKSNKCLSCITILEKLNEWKKTEKKEEKEEIIRQLVRKYANERGKIRKIIEEVCGLI